jgi:hypothetical protein
LLQVQLLATGGCTEFIQESRGLPDFSCFFSVKRLRVDDLLTRA